MFDAFGTINATDKAIEKLAASDLEIPWPEPGSAVAFRDLLAILQPSCWAGRRRFIN